MDKRYIHMLGAFLVVSTVYLSGEGPILTAMILVPILAVSLGVHLENHILKMAGLVGTTLYSQYLLPSLSLNDIYLTAFIIIVLILPFVLYWWVVLTGTVHPDIHASAVAASYFFMILLSFYLLVILLDVNTYLLAAGNEAPQSLLLAALVLLFFIPYNSLLSR